MALILEVEYLPLNILPLYLDQEIEVILHQLTLHTPLHSVDLQMTTVQNVLLFRNYSPYSYLGLIVDSMLLFDNTKLTFFLNQ